MSTYDDAPPFPSTDDDPAAWSARARAEADATNRGTALGTVLGLLAWAALLTPLVVAVVRHH